MPTAVKNRLYIFSALLLFFAAVNPFVELLEFSLPIPYMFAHYSIFVSGMLVGYSLFHLQKKLAIFAAIIALALAVFWHLPYPFALAASFLTYRILSEISFLLGGFLLGSTLITFSARVKGILLGLWVFADNLLSIIFIILPDYYSRQGVAISPYENYQFPLLGLAMILLMNSVVGVVIYIYTRKVIATINSLKN